MKKSQVDYGGCVGAIDGMLVWTTKSSTYDCQQMSVGAKRFYCGRKKRYGFAIQAVCDADRRFLDVVISHPGMANDLLVCNMSDMRHQFNTVGTC